MPAIEVVASINISITNVLIIGITVVVSFIRTNMIKALYYFSFEILQIKINKQLFFVAKFYKLASLCYLGQLKADSVDRAIYKLHFYPFSIDFNNMTSYLYQQCVLLEIA